MKKLVIIPAYNESENILGLVEKLKKKKEYDYIVVNDKSTDDTERLLLENNIPHICEPVNLGIGGAVQTGYIYALRNGYEIAIQIDGDGQHDPDYLDELVMPIERGQADICIGSRFINNEGFQSSKIRRMGISFLSTIIKLCTGKKIYDVTSGYRAVNRNYMRLYAHNYSQDYPEPEAIVTGMKNHADILEIPVVMKERENGQSSINYKRSVYYMLKVSLALILASLIEKGEIKE